MRPIILLLALLLSPVARAGVVLLDDHPELPPESPLTLVSQEVDVEIVDQVASTRLVQVFRNDTAVELGGTYLLPLTERAAVQEYAFWIGGRRVVSTLKEKDQATRDFAQAEAAGEAAAVVHQAGPGTFTARFTPLAPGEVRRFEVVYRELLPYEAGTVRYSHPLDYERYGLPAVDELSVSVVVRDSKPLSNLRSSTFPLQVSSEAGALSATVRQRDVRPDADFELEYQLESRDFGLGLRTFDDGGDEGFFVAMLAPQEQTDDGDIVRKDVAFVFDTSGSMSGSKIDEARSALKACLNLMNPGDGLYLLAFSDALNPWQVRPEDVGEAQRLDATAFVDSLKAGGGTNIHDAVITGLDVLSHSDRPTALVFLTDGLGSRSPQETLRAVQDHNPEGRTRVFSFGVGDDVNGAFLERLGRENRGGYTAIGRGASIDAAVADFYSSISRPVLTDLQLDFGAVTPNRLYPAVLPDVYQGQRLVITGRYRGQGATELRVSGRIGGEQRELQLPVTFGPGDTEHPWVARLWARRRAEHLLADIRMYGETAEARAEVVSLSRTYGFATPYTSLVAHADPRVASLSPARIKPGDPELRIPAPEAAVAVTAFLPFGEVKDLRFLPDSGLWGTRFLVPREVDDGVYWIHVVATLPDGASVWDRISYTVDTTAPVMEIELDGPTQPGDALHIEARPVVGFLELGEEMIRALGRDAADRARAYVDVKRVIARLSGEDIEVELLATDAEAPGWRGALDLPSDLDRGEYEVEVTATDVAGNVHTVSARFEVL